MATLAKQAISDKTATSLRELSEQWNCSISETVRRILDGYFDSEKRALIELLEMSRKGKTTPVDEFLDSLGGVK